MIGLGIGVNISKSSAGAPAIISDGNTVGWYDYMLGVTKDGSNLVSDWASQVAHTGNTLSHVTGATHPLWSTTGILFNGVADELKATFVWIQPEFIYMVWKQVTWTSGDTIFDGNTADTINWIQQLASPKLRLYAGAYFSAATDGPAVNTWSIVRMLINGASSKIIIDDGVPLTGASLPANAGGFSLGVYGNGTQAWSNIEVKEIILRKVADSAVDEAAIYNYLKAKYSL